MSWDDEMTQQEFAEFLKQNGKKMNSMSVERTGNKVKILNIEWKPTDRIPVGIRTDGSGISRYVDLRGEEVETE